MTIHAQIQSGTAAEAPRELAENHFRAALSALDAAGAEAASGWTPQRQAQFLGAIADGATVQDAAAEAGLSRRSAYALRRSPRGKVFHLGWQAAEILARDSLRDTLWDRAQNGQSWTTVRDDGERVITTTRHRFDNRLALAMLTRLEDKVVEAHDSDDVILSGHFDDFIALLATGEAPAEPDKLLDRVVPAFEGEDAIGTCEPCESRETPPVWQDMSGMWWTDFPPPPDFRGEAHEAFGEPGYQRTLTATERESIAHFAHEQHRLKREARTNAETARDAWFAAADYALTPEAVVVEDAINSPPSGRGDGAGAPTGEGLSAES